MSTPETPAPEPADRGVARRHGRRIAVLLAVAVLAVLGWVVAEEVRTSRLQAQWLSGLAARATYEVGPGPSPAIRYPGAGPFDLRFGYHELPQRLERLQREGFVITGQARQSPTLMGLMDDGLFPIYREKTQAGLALDDCRGETLVSARSAERQYPSLEAVPPLLVESLLFIENRELLDPGVVPTRNPAIEWSRVGKALVDQLVHQVDDDHSTSGGSTLATQIEKYRHSPEGRTSSAREKLRQMASASVRAYLDGPDTHGRRRRIVLDYLNTVPLSAQAGMGEVHGLGDGLWAWYGRDFAEVNGLLRGALESTDPAQRERGAHAYKQALSLMIAQRRPSYYLAQGQEDLRALTDSHVRLMADAGVIGPALREAALRAPLELRRQADVAHTASFVDRKAASSVRGRLQSLLGMPRAYDVERLDLDVASPLDGAVQRRATELLRSLREAKGAQAAGLYGFRLLSPGDDPAPIAFSFTLFERAPHANLLRVQTDNLDQPFDMNEGARLDLGSTAKLRTLVTYLELVAQLHARWSGLDTEALQALQVPARDRLARWARDHLAQAADKGLEPMLEAALERRYSASPHEAFFTGGGVHTFANFEPNDNGRTMTVREALTRSVNLVFVRLMRDVVYHVMARSEGENAALLDDASNPRRAVYLARFADREGREYLARFHRQHVALDAEASLERLLRTARSSRRIAATLFGVEPAADDARLAQVLAARLPESDRSPKALQALRAQLGPERWSLADRAYLAGVHPLELWLVGWLRANPDAPFDRVVEASVEERQAVYGWLFKTRHKSAQDARIRQLVEIDAFAEIHRMWQRVGYPFGALTPSYASALGASGDRPAALAELMGIIVNRGMRVPTARIEGLHFARETPFETRLEYAPPPGERVMPAEVADVVRRVVVGVVEDGTAKRLKGALVLKDGRRIDIGAKTGTGDHRFDVHGPGGRLIASRVVGRSATLMFLVGDRYYGTIVAHVREPHAEKYKFTSALVVQLLKALTPTLAEMMDEGACRAPEADAAAGAGGAAPVLTRTRPGAWRMPGARSG